MKRIALILTTVFTLGLLSGCDLINKQMQMQQQPQQRTTAAAQNTKTSVSTTTTQGRLINGPLGTIGQHK